MKYSTPFIEKSTWHRFSLMLCLTGFIGQSCSKSELALNPESLKQSMTLCKNTSALKDSIDQQKNKNFDSTIISTLDTLKASIVLKVNKTHAGILNNKSIQEESAVADSVYTYGGITVNPGQLTNSLPVDKPVVIAPPPNKPNTIAPPPVISTDEVKHEISVKTSQGVILHPPKNLLIGISRAYPLAIDTYTGLLTQMPGGENEFWFYGKTNQYSYPTGDWITQANGYSTIDLPTHAVNARAGSDGQHPEYNNVICKIEYTIKDAQGNVVMFCKDTKGGFHPTFVPNERGNNHPKESQRFLPYGTYTVEFKNLTEGSINAPIRVTYNRAGGDATMGEYFDATVNNQQTVTFAINIFEQDHDISMFKLNCNMVP